MRDLIRFFSYRSFVFGALVVGGLLAFLLAREGLSAPDVAVLAVYAAGCVALNRALRAPPARISRFDALAAFDRVLQAGRPTLLEFYSDQCAACLANQPLMQSLENEAGHRLQVLRVNARDAIGAALANRYDVTFTPTFLLFNPRGEKEDEYVFVINRARVLYWLDRQRPSA